MVSFIPMMFTQNSEVSDPGMWNERRGVENEITAYVVGLLNCCPDEVWTAEMLVGTYIYSKNKMPNNYLDCCGKGSLNMLPFLLVPYL